jgi:hypothetical protein
MFDKSGYCIAEKLIKLDGRVRVFSRDVIPLIDTVLLCLWCPNDF